MLTNTHVSCNIKNIKTRNVIKKGGMILNEKAISEKLVELRGDRSQGEVANAIGISKSALSMYENGERIPRDAIKIRIADFYKTPIQDIFFPSKTHET